MRCRPRRGARRRWALPIVSVDDTSSVDKAHWVTQRTYREIPASRMPMAFSLTHTVRSVSKDDKREGGRTHDDIHSRCIFSHIHLPDHKVTPEPIISE